MSCCYLNMDSSHSFCNPYNRAVCSHTCTLTSSFSPDSGTVDAIGTVAVITGVLVVVFVAAIVILILLRRQRKDDRSADDLCEPLLSSVSTPDNARPRNGIRRDDSTDDSPAKGLTLQLIATTFMVRITGGRTWFQSILLPSIYIWRINRRNGLS